MTKKPTYQELEYDVYTKVFIYVLCSLILIVGLTIILIIVGIENQQLKSQLNQTEGKDYSCDFVGPIKPEDNRVCEDEIIKMKGGNKYEK